MKYLLALFLSIFISLGAMASNDGENAPLLKKMVDFSEVGQTIATQPAVVSMSDGPPARPISYNIALLMGRSVACWNYAHPECFLEKCQTSKFIGVDSEDHNGAGAMFQNCSVFTTLLGSIAEGIISTCCLTCGYCNCCYNSQQFCIYFTSGGCVCGNAGCMSVAGKMGIAAGISLGGAICCCGSILACRHALPYGVTACEKLGCNNLAEGFKSGHHSKKTEITGVHREASNITPPPQIIMSYQNLSGF